MTGFCYFMAFLMFVNGSIGLAVFWLALGVATRPRRKR